MTEFEKRMSEAARNYLGVQPVDDFEEGFRAGFAEAVRMLRSEESAGLYVWDDFTPRQAADWLESQTCRKKAEE